MLLFSMLFSIHPIEDLSQHFGFSCDKYLAVQLHELPTEDLCKISRPAEKEASQAIVLNSFEPLVVFEQVYWTCLRMTDPFQSDMGCRYPLKLFNITLTANPSHPFRQVHAPVVQTEVPKEAEAKNNPGFFLKFHYATRSRSFEKLRRFV